MSLHGRFNSKYVPRNKVTGQEIRTFEDLPSTRLRHSDGSHAQYRGGKIVAGTHEAPKAKKKAAKDVPGGESKFYKPTDVSTIVEKARGETDTAGEKGASAHVRKKIDVHARAMRL